MYDLLFKSLDEYTPVTVNIYELLDHLAGSVDVGDGDDWITDMFVDKINDVSAMVWLLPSILHNGLQCPLNVVYDEYGQFKMGNGHHRLVLALLCGIEEIQIVVSIDSCDFKNSEIGDKEQDSWIVSDIDSDAQIFDEILDDINSMFLILSQPTMKIMSQLKLN